MIFDFNHLNLDNLSDMVSVTPLLMYFSLFYNVLVFGSAESLKFFISMLFVAVSTDVIKRLPMPKSLYKLTRRPEGAKNCDFLSKGGICKANAPGCPSGHMATTVFFLVVTMMLYSRKYSTFKAFAEVHYRLIGFSVLLILLMGWSRYYKKCHNVIQIIGGSLFGLGMAFLVNRYII